MQIPRGASFQQLLEVSPNRLEALSDGVFAIVITLLVLEIRVPELSSSLSNDQLVSALVALLPKLLGYIASFLMIAIYWVAHHNVFHLLQRCDRICLWLNLLFLMCLAFIPFPTALLGEYPQTQVAISVYGGVLLANAVTFNMLWLHIQRRPAMLHKGTRSSIVQIMTKDYLVGLLLYGLAFGVSFLLPIVSIFLYIATPVLFIFFNSRNPV